GGPAPKLDSEEDKTLYALGLLVGRTLPGLGLKPNELQIVQAGIADAALGAKPKVELEVYGPKVQQLAQAHQNARSEKEKANAKPLLDKEAKEAGAVQTPSGLIIRTLKPGKG